MKKLKEVFKTVWHRLGGNITVYSCTDDFLKEKFEEMWKKVTCEGLALSILSDDTKLEPTVGEFKIILWKAYSQCNKDCKKLHEELTATMK